MQIYIVATCDVLCTDGSPYTEEAYCLSRERAEKFIKEIFPDARYKGDSIWQFDQYTTVEILEVETLD